MYYKMKNEEKTLKKHTLPLNSNETDKEIDKKLKNRFNILEMMAKAAIEGDIKSLIVSGPAGLGKSYTIEEALEEADPTERNHTVVKGYVKATGLYRTLWDYKDKGKMVVFDDSDSIFNDDTTLAMLKAVTDSTEKRKVSYLSEFNMVDEDSNVIPRTFQFNGTIVFITNIDFDAIIEKGNKLAPHLAAMVSRSHYIDLAMKTRRDYFIRIKQVVKEGLLKKGKGLNQREENKVVRFIENNQDNLREMSLRVALKLADIIRKHPRQFEEIAKVTVTKGL